VNPDELVSRYPRLFHMAADGSWPSVADRGLLSTSALLDLFEIGEPERTEIEACRRPETVSLRHDVHGTASIRDNKPLLETRLAGCLEGGMTPEQWYRLLNGRVFFWPTRKRVETLLSAAAYRASPQVVIEIDTAALIAAHRDSIEVSTINSGATRPFAWPRGPDTFRALDDFDYEARRHRGQSAIAELTVIYAVTNVTALAVTVERRLPDGTRETLWPA
jgi:hypothetical protein